MTILWVLNIDARYGIRHGAVLRYTNFSRGLLASGHRVYFVLTRHPEGDREPRNQFLVTLREDACISDFFEIDGPAVAHRRSLLTRFPVIPRGRDWVLRDLNRGCVSDLENLVRDLKPDVCILSHRPYLFLLKPARTMVSTIVDWCDSLTLQLAREIRFQIQSGELRGLLPAFKNLAEVMAEEMYYGRYAHANIVVSAEDKRWLDRLNRSAGRNFVLANGVSPPEPPLNRITKDPNRLIFTGSMGFPPNYRAALWFIERVMPLLLLRNKEIRLVIAGQEPVPELRAKAGPHVEVTGLVPDISVEIARSQLYVAPLRSGSGFRNKIVEALNSGTFVIGTPMALEFLDDRLRSKLLTASNAHEFADLILNFLENPQAFNQRLAEARQILRNEYLWPSRVQQLEALCAGLKNGLREVIV